MQKWNKMATARISSGPHSSVNFTTNGMKICRNAILQVILNSRPLHLTIANPLGSFLPYQKNDQTFYKTWYKQKVLEINAQNYIGDINGLILTPEDVN